MVSITVYVNAKQTPELL